MRCCLSLGAGRLLLAQGPANWLSPTQVRLPRERAISGDRQVLEQRVGRGAEAGCLLLGELEQPLESALGFLSGGIV